MKKVLLAAATVLSMSTFAAAEPVRLTDSQMDSVTAAGKNVRVRNVSTNIAIMTQHGNGNAVIMKQHGKGKVIAKRLSNAEVIAIVRKHLRKIPDRVRPYPQRATSLAQLLRIRF